MTTDTANLLVGEGWHDRLEAGVRGRIRGLIEELLEEELTAMLGRARYARARAVERSAGAASESAAGESDASDVMLPVAGQRNGHRDRQVMGTFGATTVSVPRARLEAADGKTSEWQWQRSWAEAHARRHGFASAIADSSVPRCRSAHRLVEPRTAHLVVGAPQSRA
jgi:transposase-like protein